MSKNIGFIGCGNMAQAIIGGIVSSKFASPENITASDISEKALSSAAERFGINISNNNKTAAENADVIVLAVKPQFFTDMLADIKPVLKKDVLIITIAAGIPVKFLEETLGTDTKIVRVMPNTAALVGESITLVCKNSMVTEDEFSYAVDLFNNVGKTEIVDEPMIDKALAIGGSSPAMVYMFIEAMADGAVLHGVPRDKAYKIAAQAVLGSAKMVLESGIHPGALKDMVCSPAGTTIEAVYTLEKNNFRGAVMGAIDSCTQKAINMSKSKK